MLIFKTIRVVDHTATGAWARTTRVQLNLSLRAAAQLAGLVPSYLSELETGNRAWRGKKAIEYARWLGSRSLLSEMNSGSRPWKGKPRRLRSFEESLAWARWVGARRRFLDSKKRGKP